MPSNGVRPVHDFETWYDEVMVGGDLDRLERRWKNVRTLAAEADPSHVDTLLTVALGHEVPVERLGAIKTYFKDDEEDNNREPNDRELQILSGSVLAYVLDRDDEIAAYAALTISTASMVGARPYDLPMNLTQLAEYALVRISELNRARPDLRSISTISPISFTETKAKLDEQPDVGGMAAALEVYATEVNRGFEALRNEVSAINTKNEKFLAVQDEELNLLWWIIGGYCSDLGKSFRDISENARALVLGSELAGMTSFLPGPPSIKAMLCRAGLSPEIAIPIPKAVNACSSEWLNSVINRQSGNSPLFEPIHLAIYRKLESNDDTSWIEGWTTECNLDKELAFSITDIGWLFYCECLIQGVNGRTG